jgi:hypothetical protein
MHNSHSLRRVENLMGTQDGANHDAIFRCAQVSTAFTPIYAVPGELLRQMPVLRFTVTGMLKPLRFGDVQAEGDGWLASLVQIRAELMHGDHRALYLGWLLAVQSEEIDEDRLEPPVPPGLGDLNAPLDRLADFLRIDGDLIAAAAECSLGEPASRLTGKEVRGWLLNLPSKEKDAILARLIEGDDPHLAAELRQRATVEVRGLEKSAERPHRTAGDILARAKILADTRRKKEAEQRVREKARIEREQAEKRKKHLESLMRKEGNLWAKVDHLIATRLPKRYDEAVSLLQDLRDLAAMQAESSDFSLRMRALHDEHAKKPSLVERFRKAKLL